MLPNLYHSVADTVLHITINMVFFLNIFEKTLNYSFIGRGGDERLACRFTYVRTSKDLYSVTLSSSTLSAKCRAYSAVRDKKKKRKVCSF